MTIQQAMLSAITKLQTLKDASPHLDAEVLLSFTMKKQKTFILTNPDKKLSAIQQKKFNGLIARRKNGIPVAYLIGQKEFYGMNFFINSNVLVPRPDTETLIESAIHAVRQQTPDKKTVIADIGTGSGCIAITLAKYLPQVKIIATDISPQAIDIAKKNARRQKVYNKIRFIEGDLLHPLILKKIKCDIMVANLPYLTSTELKNVRHEPKAALYGGKMGVELIERLLIQSSAILNPGSIILLEISPTQVKLVDFIIEQQLSGKKVSFIKDLNGRDRVVKIE